MINFINTKKILEYKQTITDVINVAIEKLNIVSNIEFNLSLVTPGAIKKLNNNFRAINKVTDVLSFPNLNLNYKNLSQLSADNFKDDINPQTNNIMLGDIVINLKQVKIQAKLYSNFTRELCYLTLHGFLHLLGYDHLTEEDKTAMRDCEEKILNSLNIF